MTRESGSEEDTNDDLFSSADPYKQLRESADSIKFSQIWLEVQIALFKGDAKQGVVVLGNAQKNQFAPVAVWPQGSMGSPGLVGAIEKAIAKSQTITSRTRRAQSSGKPQKVLTIASPLIVDKVICGAVAIEISDCSNARQEQIISELGWGLAWLESHVRRNQHKQTDRLAGVIELTATALHYEKFQAAATAVATEFAGMMSCERVSIGFLSGKRAKIAVVSHSAGFGKKANIIRAIEAAMDEAIDQQATIVYPGFDDGPPQVNRSHKQLLTEHHVGNICTVPLAQGANMLGAITLERPSDTDFDTDSVALAENVAAVLGPLLDIKRKDDRWLIRKAADSAGSTLRKLVGPRHTALKLFSAGFLFLLLFFIFAKDEYRVSVDASIEGAIQRAITTPIAGYINEAKYRAGDVVKAGDELFSLDDRELILELVKWTSQKAQYSREQTAAMASHDRAKASVLSAQIEQAEAQIALVNEQLKRIKGIAPFDSLVVAGDLSQSLGAPVERGDVLFEIAPLDAYRVILKVEERDIGELQVNQSGILVLSGMPGEKLEIRIGKITPVAIAEEGVNYFRVEAELISTTPDLLRPGMEGVAKVNIEERRVIWIWTYKAIHWLRLFFWSWTP